MRGYNNIIDTELISLIKKVNSLGINVVYTDQHISVQCMTVVLDQMDDNTREMVPVVDGTPSPFTWKLGSCEFKKWARIATKYPYNKVNELLASMVRRMSTDSFNKLRVRPRLESEFLEKLYTELQTIGFKTKVSRGMVTRLMLVYGGLVDRQRNLENFINQIFNMVISGTFKVDRCRSCRFCKLCDEGTGRKCVSATNNGYTIPENILFGDLLKNFPDVTILPVGDKFVGLTPYIPESKKSCVYYKRRF